MPRNFNNAAWRGRVDRSRLRACNNRYDSTQNDLEIEKMRMRRSVDMMDPARMAGLPATTPGET
jgi:hypothetical protein